jgi:hypothetical protein
MSPKSFLVVGLALTGAVWAGNSVIGCTGDEPVSAQDSGSETSTPGNPNGKANGQTCAAGGDCKSGACTDGVCCESSCSGKCEACNVPGSLGTCAAIPDGEDPASECPTIPLPPQDGGVIEDDGGSDAGPAINLPEAGVTADDKTCAGKCNGKRACGFPDKKKTCGTTFCNSTSAQGRAACDGEGHCQLGLEACEAYSCPEGSTACKATCTQPSDCLDTHFCDATNTCKARLGNGSVCSSAAQCQTGFCVEGVCCNDSCGVNGGSCKQPGKVGQCTCSACATGACSLWYRDADGDGFGDATGTVGNGGAMPGCVAGPAPAAAFVKDNKDCDDGNALAKPGQTAYFSTPRANNSFDYNCSGTLEKETPEYVGGTCGFCGLDRGGLCSKATTCGTAGRAAYHGCAGFPSPIIGGGTICKSSSQSAFHSTVACGQSGTLFTCGTCAVVNGSSSASTSSRAQGCH